MNYGLPLSCTILIKEPSGIFQVSSAIGQGIPSINQHSQAISLKKNLSKAEAMFINLYKLQIVHHNFKALSKIIESNPKGQSVR